MLKTNTTKWTVIASVLALSIGAGCAPGDDEEDDVVSSADALTTTKTLTPTADAYVDASKPTTNFGGAATLLTDTYPIQYRSYLRFDVPALTGTVSKAVVRLWVTDPSPNGPLLAETTTTWSESTITWSNAPAWSGSFGDLATVNNGTWVEYDVTKKVKASGAYGFAVVPTSGDGVDFSSRTGAHPPQLVLTMTVTPPPPPPPPPPPTGLACPSGFAHEVFRDDFNGSAVDTAKWQVIDGAASPTGGEFTRLTNMRRENATVSGGMLHLSSMRHCSDPHANRAAPENPGQCAGGKNYYSGAWMKTNGGYAVGKGHMSFLAKMPTPVRGSFPALWARNTEGGALYIESDMIEMWWDLEHKGVLSDTNKFTTTTFFSSSYFKTTGNVEGPWANVVTAFHVWEVEWDAAAAEIRYSYRDSPGATPLHYRTINAQTAGLSGHVSAADWVAGLSRGFRPYIDFAVQPDSVWHVGPDSAPTYNPDDLLVDSVIVCAP